MFDVDRTLLRGDCMLLLGRARQPHLLAWGLAWLALLPALLAKACGRISTGRLKERFLERFVLTPGHDPAELQAFLEGPFAEQLQQRLNPPALQRLRWHQSRGERVILCSASPRFILQPLADRLGVELLATEVACEGNRLLPRLQGANCKGPEKVRRLEAHLGADGGLAAWSMEAYGDSRGDRELLRSAERPHYRSFADAPRPYPSLRLKPLLPVLAIALLGYGLLGLWSQGDQLVPLLARIWPVILAGLGLVLLGYGLRFLRWRLLLAALGERPPWRNDARLWMGSYAFTATPGKSGEAVRSVLLRRLLQPLPPLAATLIGALAWGLEGVSLALLLQAMGSPLASVGGAMVAHTAATLLIRLMTLWFATALGVVCLLLPAPKTSAQTSG